MEKFAVRRKLPRWETPSARRLEKAPRRRSKSLRRTQRGVNPGSCAERSVHGQRNSRSDRISPSETREESADRRHPPKHRDTNAKEKIRGSVHPGNQNQNCPCSTASALRATGQCIQK